RRADRAVPPARSHVGPAPVARPPPAASSRGAAAVREDIRSGGGDTGPTDLPVARLHCTVAVTPERGGDSVVPCERRAARARCRPCRPHPRRGLGAGPLVGGRRRDPPGAGTGEDALGPAAGPQGARLHPRLRGPGYPPAFLPAPLRRVIALGGAASALAPSVVVPAA